MESAQAVVWREFLILSDRVASSWQAVYHLTP